MESPQVGQLLLTPQKTPPQRSINIDVDFSEVGPNGMRHPKIIISASTIESVNSGMKELEQNADVSYVESRLLASGPDDLGNTLELPAQGLKGDDLLGIFNGYSTACPKCIFSGQQHVPKLGTSNDKQLPKESTWYSQLWAFLYHLAS